LIHERLDYWFTVLTWELAQVNSRRKLSIRKFAPPWLEIPLGDPDSAFLRFLDLAEGGEDADDLNANGRRGE
jgi:hypothetical protein